MNNQNKVTNPKVEVPKTTDMNDENYLNDLLESLKNMVNNYSYALNEASNRPLYDVIKTIFDETSNLLFVSSNFCCSALSKQYQPL